MRIKSSTFNFLLLVGMLYGLPLIVMGNALKITAHHALAGDVIIAIGIIVAVCVLVPILIIRFIFLEWIVDGE